MHVMTLKVVETDFARDKTTKMALNFRTDESAFNPTVHEPMPFSYRETLRAILNQPVNPQQGATADDMDHAITILRKLKKRKDGDTLRLEDADYDYLKRKIEATPWSFIELWIDDFRQDILQAPVVADDETVPTNLREITDKTG